MNKPELIKAIDKKIKGLNKQDATGILHWNEFKDFVNDFKEPKIVIDWIKLRDFFNQTTGKQIRVVNNAVKQKIKARIREGYTKEDIICCIKNSVKDEYHIETGLRYITLEYISRGTTIDKYLTDPSAKVDDGFKAKEGSYTR